MAKHVLAIQPQLVVEPAEHEAQQIVPAKIEWNQEHEVHARVLPERPESHREKFNNLLPALDLKRLAF